MNPTLQDALASVATFALALSWLKLMDSLADWGWLDQTLSRKLIHTGTGPLFVLCWPLFSEYSGARWWAALVPLAITFKFAAIGLGWIADPAAVKSMTRHNDPREILRGPLIYGAVFVVCTVIFWRHSPVGILALMILCGGDGLADIVGRRLGKHKLPFSTDKSWAGSAAMFLGSCLFGYGALMVFNWAGYFQPSLAALPALVQVGAVALAATLVEALPFRDIDNLTLTLVSLLLGQMLMGGISF